MSWSESDYQAYLSRKTKQEPMAKPSKYFNKKITVDGEKFDSQKEYRRFYELKVLEHSGQIQHLKRQVEFVLIPALVISGKKEQATKYVCDFQYIENGKTITEDVKSEITRKHPVYRLKRKLMAWVHDIEIRET